MMKDSHKVAVIILNWNGFNATVDCLESIKETTYKNYKIVLGDNTVGKLESIFIEHAGQNAG